VQAGATLTSPSLKGFTDVKNITRDITPSIGIIAQFNMGLLNFRPSLNYLQNSYSFEHSAIKKALLGGNPDTLQQIVNDYKQTSFEIPLDLVLPVKLKKGKLLLSVAPVITVGIKADSVAKITQTPGSPITVRNAINFGSNLFEIKKTDWGTRFGIGYQFNGGLQVNAAYRIGLTDIRNDATTSKNHYMTLSLAWFLFK
jgi:hypothetical protein